MEKNIAKFLSYKEAWRRIKTANEQGFYFEVVTLCESIISDRLLAYVRGANPNSRSNITTPFGKLIAEWRRLAGEDLTRRDGSNLGEMVDAWRKERNLVIHGIAKSLPGTATEKLPSFIERAKTAACNGSKLATEVSNWQRRRLRAYRRSLTR